ncbi:MAG TPA: hypothetical protein VF795_02705 [Desulfuromonadaceae bacterium]
MADDEKKDKVDELTVKIQALTATVEKLSARLAEAQAQRPPAEVTDEEGAPADLSEVTEEVLSWAGKAHLLPRISTLCFLLVVALVLRTLTDNDLIDTIAGSALGMGYAALLILTGWHRYARKSPLAPVFAACGGVLLALIVVETHNHFQALPVVPAYLLLMAAGIGMALISYRYNVLIPISVGTLGMCLAGAAIDYPNPFFPYLAMILWTANLLGFYAARLKRCSWLRWIVLVVSLAVLHLWATKINFIVTRHEGTAALLAVPWFLPVVAVFAGTYVLLALAGIVRSGAARCATFDYVLPTIGTVWLFYVAHLQVVTWGGDTAFLGWIGAGFAILLFGVAFSLAGRRGEENPGANAFVFAGLALMALALPTAGGSLLYSLPPLALAACALLPVSHRWQNGGTRATSYLAQLYAVAALSLSLPRSGPASVDIMTAIPSGLLALFSICHYILARRTPPPAGSRFFCDYDRKDRSAVLLLLAALVGGFFLLRVPAYHLLVMMPGNVGNSYRCAQSIIINLAAAVLMLYAFLRRNREIRNVAILVTLVGAAKVFTGDLISSHGLPLVLSVFTFGAVAAMESITLGRWQREPGRADSRRPGGGQ